MHCGNNGNGNDHGYYGDQTRGKGNCKGNSSGHRTVGDCNPQGEGQDLGSHCDVAEDGSGTIQDENPITNPNDELLIDTFTDKQNTKLSTHTPDMQYDTNNWISASKKNIKIYSGVIFSESRTEPALARYSLDTTQAIDLQFDLLPRGAVLPDTPADHAYVGIGDEDTANLWVGMQFHPSENQPDWVVVRDADRTIAIAELPFKTTAYVHHDIEVRIVGSDIQVFADGVLYIDWLNTELDGDDQWLWLQAPPRDSSLPGIDNILVELLY